MNLLGKQDGSPKVEGLWERILAWVERNLAIAAIVVWSIFTLIVSRRSDFARTGQFGDSFGTLNALFASLAAVAAFKAYWSQRQQLKEQQEEFRVQRHESHLFFLMEELREAVRGVTVKDLAIRKGPPDELVGPVAVCQLENLLLGMIGTESAEVLLLRESVEYLRRLSFIVEARFALFDGNAGRETPKPEQGGQWAMPEDLPPIPSFATRNIGLRLDCAVIAQQFNRFYEECAGAPLGNIFRLQAAILRYIDNQSIPEPQRKQHAELFKAQVTDPELHLLLYYALSDLAGGDDLRQIMVRYNILEALWRKKPEFIWHRIPEISYFETEASPS